MQCCCRPSKSLPGSEQQTWLHETLPVNHLPVGLGPSIPLHFTISINLAFFAFQTTTPAWQVDKRPLNQQLARPAPNEQNQAYLHRRSRRSSSSFHKVRMKTWHRPYFLYKSDCRQNNTVYSVWKLWQQTNLHCFQGCILWLFHYFPVELQLGNQQIDE